jgi:hypothetical protein
MGIVKYMLSYMSDHFVSINEGEEIGADMKQMITLDHLPALAGVPVIAQFKWTMSPRDGRVLLYRAETDPTPQELNGPSGEGSVEILKSRILYYELLSGTHSFQLSTTSCKLANV